MQLLDDLGRTVDRVREAVPRCTGLSLARIDREPITLAVSSETISVLDAVQYLDGGPVVDAVARGCPDETPLSRSVADDRWPLFARACAIAGVRGTLTLPVTDGHLVLGIVQVYAASDEAVTHDRAQLAHVVDTFAPAMITGSSDTLTARQLAEQAPRSLRGEGAVNRAIASLAVHLDIDVTAAYERLDEAAVRAGITIDCLALALRDLQH